MLKLKDDKCNCFRNVKVKKGLCILRNDFGLLDY